MLKDYYDLERTSSAGLPNVRCWRRSRHRRPAALGWSVRQLGERADISFNTVSRFENGGDMLSTNLDKVQRALEGEGIEFLNSARPGVQWTE